MENEMVEVKNKEILKAAMNAAATICAIYDWIDKIEKEGGAQSISGVSTCNAFLKSMKTQRPRVQTLIIDPLNKALNPERKP